MKIGMEGTSRRILHVDLDAFFASVEQRDNPALKGRPVAVGGDVNRGVVAAASYEAREFGIRSAMPMRQAMDKCSDLVVVKPRFDVYRSVSKEIHAIFKEHTDIIEPVSLDEAYLDVTHNAEGLAASEIAKIIRASIFEKTGLTASAGVSFNKFLAKMGSDMRKPNGMTIIRPERARDLIAEMPVGKFHGIGPATAAKMEQLGIRTGMDLRRQSREFLMDRFGKSGGWYFKISRADDDRPVRTDRERKSYGSEDTFEKDVSAPEELARELDVILERVWEDRLRIDRLGRTVTLKIKYADFEQITRSISHQEVVDAKDRIRRMAHGLLETLIPVAKPVRLIGVSISNLGGVGELPASSSQLSLI